MTRAAPSRPKNAKPMPIEFSKLTGSGNDFVCISNLDGRFDAVLADAARVGTLAKTLCGRAHGVGADGVIFATPVSKMAMEDVSARFFEPDGSEAELCGNGAACFARWAIDSGWVKGSEVTIATSVGMVRGQKTDGGYVRVCIPLPRDIRRNVQVQAGGTTWDCDFAITGVPHLVVYVPDVEQTPVAMLGPLLRYHEQFKPRGVNVNFTQVLGEGRLAVRTWEFGVEGETLACGTGSATAAVTSAMRFNWGGKLLTGDEPALVNTRGGDVMKIYFSIREFSTVTDVCLETVVRHLFRGVLEDGLSHRLTNDKDVLTTDEHR